MGFRQFLWLPVLTLMALTACTSDAPGMPPKPVLATAVPNVVGDAQGDALVALENVALSGAVQIEPNASVPAGVVFAQSPAPGTLEFGGGSVMLLVSSGGGAGASPLVVPNVVAQAEADANTIIAAAGLKVGNGTFQTTTEVAPGAVISQSPVAGTPTTSGSAVDLVINGNPSSPPILGTLTA